MSAKSYLFKLRKMAVLRKIDGFNMFFHSLLAQCHKAKQASDISLIQTRICLPSVLRVLAVFQFYIYNLLFYFFHTNEDYLQ